MSKFCPLCNAHTHCTDNCTSCLEEEYKEKVELLEYLTSDIDTIVDKRGDVRDVKKNVSL